MRAQEQASSAILAAGTGWPSTRAPAIVPPRRVTPIKWWAAAGAAILLVGAYAMTRWILSGPTQNTIGRSEVPEFMQIAGIVWQAGGLATTLGLLWWFLLRPWRRQGRISFDGLLLLGLLTMYWQDMLVNATQFWAVYNTTLFNFGSWYNFVPLWNSPGAANYAEPFLFAGPFYIYAVFPPILAANWAMRRFKARRPQTGTLGMIGLCFGLLVGADVILEPMFMFFGLWSYPGAVQSLSIFPGRYYQYPVYEAVLWGMTWTSIACLRYFRNDRGESIAERGVERLNVSGKAKTFVRFLAIAGILNVTYLAFCNLPYQAVAVHGDAWPKDVMERPYLRGGLCGPGTDYACPGPDTPIARRGARHVAPDGSLRPPVPGE